MAVFDATNSDEDIKFLYGSDLIDFSFEVQATSTIYEWRTTGGNTITAYGTFAYDSNGELTSGTVSSVDINLSNDADIDVSIHRSTALISLFLFKTTKAFGVKSLSVMTNFFCRLERQVFSLAMIPPTHLPPLA